MKYRLTYSCLLIITFVFFCQSCVPVSSELQSARTVGEGNIEITPSYSSTNISIDQESENVQSHLGFQAAYGLSEKLDIRFRYACR